MDMYIEKFGKARVEAMLPQMKQTGLSEGIAFSYGGFTGNTFESHRLIWKAKEDGGSELQDKVIESLFKAYFEEEQSMGEVSVLQKCAARAGMDVSNFFENDDIGKTETLMELEEYRNAYHVTGVPFLISTKKMSMSGAQPADSIMKVLRKLV